MSGVIKGFCVRGDIRILRQGWWRDLISGLVEGLCVRIGGGLGTGPDDLNKVFLVDLWSIFMEYSDLREGFWVWWPHLTNCEI